MTRTQQAASSSSPGTNRLKDAWFRSAFWLWHGWGGAQTGSYHYVDADRKGMTTVRDGSAEHPPRPAGAVRLVCISDTHEQHSRLRLPDGDVLVHCGDSLINNRLFTKAVGDKKLEDFIQWLGAQPHPHKVLIGGNHDLALERLGSQGAREKLAAAGVTYLENESASVAGLVIFGTPTTPSGSGNRAFYESADSAQLNSTSSSGLPEQVDVVVSHAPPGCSQWVAACVKKLNPAVVLCGHLHALYGLGDWKGWPVVCSSIMTTKFQPKNFPIVIDVVPSK
eukprot:NODE_2527_length_1177_cov_36.411348_g2308_i0.p1 GENE.NODE_2527_length_1177_cov_36.411348_g2308_i0~~NODE_2527_length_1177_cov_36.411348_g2308_i0.p1  ORF type:complete len:280 (-),score=47.02 NODE_2527_length_1177_cov_36.411348_g2308_i0:245-1084(-)